MPHGKSSRLKLLKNGGEAQGHEREPPPEQLQQMPSNESQSQSGPVGIQNGQEFFQCCTPRICKEPQCFIGDNHPVCAVRVVCNNEDCTKSRWMHKQCFEEWEEHVLLFLKSSGRARSWNDKQRAQNLWTKKGYDLAYKACDCICGKGHIRKDLDYVPSLEDEVMETKKAKHNHRRNDKPMPVVSVRSQPIPVTNSGVEARPRLQIRSRTMSMSSTGSSPPNSASPDGSPKQIRMMNRGDLKFEFALTSEQAAAGNIFYHRPDLQAFNKLPPQKRNPYHIKMEDEGPYGNDEIRCFVLSALSTKRVTTIPCVVCGHELKVFDRYPLVDGTMFLTPQRYISDIDLVYHGHTQYMNAVCMMCAEGAFTELHCKQCNRQWDGSALQVGTMYSYDIFAASPCCVRRLKCKNCQRLAIEPGQNLPSFFSQFSRAHACKYCNATAYHFVKPLSEIFYIHRH